MTAGGSRRLRILVVHESYAIRGGEDRVVEAETASLTAREQEVHRWAVHNSEIAEWPLPRKASLLWRTSWSRDSYRQLQALVARHRPDIVHFHNTLPIISPSAIHAARDLGVGVVMTIHNYRLLCPAATFLRKGRICEDCHAHSLLRGILHGCYRGSRIQTAAVAIMLGVHRRLGTWTQCVDAFIALTDLMRSKLVAGGLPDERIHVKPNFVARPPSGEISREDYALFLGRLSAEKGIQILLEAVPHLDGTPVKVVGTGPLEPLVRAACNSLGPGIEFLGERPHAEAMQILSKSRLLVFPSLWYEGLPMTIIEAMARGVPVVATRLGAMAGMITDGREGLLFEPGNARDLSRCVKELSSDGDARERMSLAARATYEGNYSEERGHELLMDVYDAAIRSARAREQDAS